MAPSGEGKARDAPATAPRRSTRSRKGATANNDDTTPDVYRDMVAEAVAANSVQTDDPPLKRRKVEPEHVTPDRPSASRPISSTKSTPASKTTPPQRSDAALEAAAVTHDKPQQTAEYSSESEESDFTFEDVDLDQKTAAPISAPETDDDDDNIEDVAISVAPPSLSKKPIANRRKPATALEKAFRLRVHKVHFLTLLGSCVFINSRCNHAIVRKLLRSLVDKRMRSYLNPKINDTQFQRNRSFMDGLEQAKTALKAEFRITDGGMARPRWPVDGEDPSAASEGEPMDLADFIAAARKMEGSQDTGNQLFCAMLRVAGVEARLVCSLQTLPFANPPPKSSAPKKTKKPAVFAIASDTDPNLSDASASDGSNGSAGATGKVPSVRRRLGQSSFAAGPAIAPPTREKKKPIRTLSYPVYWVEAFNTAHQKWVPVDPMFTNTIGKPTKIEPPISYDLNQLMYVVALEEDGVVRDVTRRYAKAFNAKTRRQRVESSGEDGTKWLKAALRLFRRRQKLDRDQVEDAELAQKEAREGLPGNVLDFKGHPYYALERHLRRHEVIHPRRSAGKVNAGTAARPRMEDVFRRQDVLSCKSGDKWYRLGRKVKQGEQPLKHVPARNPRRRDEDEDRDAEPSITGLYSIHQTQVYVPPPVKRGKITKNAFGNLDVYVPSMVPPGGVHIRHALTQQAARYLNVDFADAVTGFKFQGRQGTAIIEGAVVPQEYGEAVEALIEGLEHEALEEASKARSLAALRLWSRFMKGLRIAERVASYSEKTTAEPVDGEDIAEIDFAATVTGPSLDFHDPTMPTAGRYSLVELTRPAKRKSKKKTYESEVEDDGGFEPSARRSGRNRRVTVVDDDDDEDEYMPDHDDAGGGFLPEDAQEVNESSGGFLAEADGDGEGDGFVPEDDEANAEGAGGGFMPQDDTGDAGGFLAEEDAEREKDLFGDDPPVVEEGGGFLMEEDVSGLDGGGFVAEEDEQKHDGGGFIAEDAGYESGAGGFLPEAAPTADAGQGIGLSAEAEKAEDVAMQSPAAGSDGDLEAVVENHAPAHQGRPATGDGVEVKSTPMSSTAAARAVGPGNTNTATTQEPTGSNNAISEKKPPAKDDAENGSDNESLLSHDPEDDDAEPDWLESD